MESAIGRGATVAVAFCDLDGLKQINDAAGHEAGDAALRRAAEALRAAAAGHAGSFVGRIGGDEFCVVLEGAGATVLGAIAEEACRALAQHQLTFSCGVAALQPGERPADVLRAADAAQYAAKRAGRGLVVIAGGGGAPDWTPSPGGAPSATGRPTRPARSPPRCSPPWTAPPRPSASSASPTRCTG